MPEHISIPLTKETYDTTKKNHRLVDSHPFVKNILTNHRTNKENIVYAEMIENVLYTLQSHFDKFNVPEFFYTHLYKKVPTNISNPLLHDLLQRIHQDTNDRVLFLSQVYMWYLSLMAGGSLLKKHMDDKHLYLFEYSPDTRNLLKNYLDFDKELSCTFREKFIMNVDDMYICIRKTFDNFM